MMPYQSKTYSLSDEVVAAIEAARAKGETPNKFLRRVLGIDRDIPACPACTPYEEFVGESDVNELTYEREE